MTPRFIVVLAGVLALQIVFIAVLNRDGDSLAAAKTAAALVPEARQAAVGDIDRLRVEGSDEARVELEKRDGQWRLPDYFDAPADPAKLERVLKTLPQAKRGFAVATSAGALDRFKVGDAAFERRLRFEKAGEALETIYLGTSAGLRKTHARNSEDQAVYVVEFPVYDAPIEPKNWFRRDLLGLEAKDIEAVTLNGQGFEGESAKEIIEKIAGLRVEGILGLEPKPEWKEALTIQIERKDETREWLVSRSEKTEGGNTLYVLKTSKHPRYMKLAYWDGDDLTAFVETPETSTGVEPKSGD